MFTFGHLIKEDMENERSKIYLAALLHDIGKFYQRADSGSVSNSKYLKEEVVKLQDVVLPQYNGYYSHKHCLWTAQFLIDYEPVFKQLVNTDLSNLANKDNIMFLAAGHHLPKDRLSPIGQIIKEADCLSSGMDRDSSDALKDDQDEMQNWDSFKCKRMTSILETIKLDAKALNSKIQWSHLPVDKLTLNKDYFAKKDFLGDPDYTTLWNDFTKEFKFIQADTYHAFSETLLNLLYKYTVCIPSSTINFPDVSLYDHLKTTAALAVCLYDYQQSGEKSDEPFLLIGADFSGIQSYIYQIVSKYAGKNLKGRSFYLRILSDAVVRFLLKSLHLFQANVIYNSGGGFYILAPNTKQARESLNNAIAIIEEKFFEVHGTNLYVAIDAIGLSKETLLHKEGKNLGLAWEKLFQVREKKKSSKFANLIQSHYDKFFIPLMQGSPAERDKITGEEIAAGEKTYKLDKIGKVKELTFQQIELGSKLKESDFMIVSDGEISYWNKQISPANLGFYYYLLRKEDIELKKEQLKASADKVSVITLNGENNSCEFIGRIKGINGINNIYGLEFYGGNDFNGKSFDEYCDKENEDAFKRLGVLRMDVDNLGNIFQSGILPERATLSRYAALSRSFDYFFSGYLNTIWQDTDPDNSFIVYSGGDDVFIVGSWDVAIELAKHIRNDFREFTSQNSAFSISGGIAIITRKFPIMKGAEESAIEEGEAKLHKCMNSSKNSISFMDMPLNWDKEFPTVENVKNAIVRFIQNGTLPKSFISKILSYLENARMINHRIMKFKVFWMLTYDLSRMRERIKDLETLNLINNCKLEICGNKDVLNGQPIESEYHPLELWAFACRWAELEMRTGNNDNNN